jgi:hypothetical protein
LYPIRLYLRGVNGPPKAGNCGTGQGAATGNQKRTAGHARAASLPSIAAHLAIHIRVPDSHAADPLPWPIIASSVIAAEIWLLRRQQQ